MALYGYIRKNYPTKTIDQLKVMTSYACTEIFIEDEAFRADEQLINLLDTIQVEDQVVIYSLESFAKRLKDLGKILSMMKQKNIRLISLKEKIDTLHSADFYTHALLLIDFQAEYTGDLIKRGLQQSKLDGKTFGRPTINENVVDKIQVLLNSKKMTMREVAEACQVSLGTVHKYSQMKDSDTQRGGGGDKQV
ncbi:recombinase family protein [Vagococcus sp. BWB3-3]|uniref:Recombinase family protein n=1 Tax=Vagococcus allomyrinae TaxID=2794353 RepID=A0A940SUG8_9ENTE|nr:recombinase family protein [Vagococcus allomyrinae]MBP1040046.1 recombinase family protein [Vagococcus allomyrinae]